jgi:pimeloyl-[acyl-carrier protein] methyl ester esterase
MNPSPSAWYLIRGLSRESRHWFAFEDELATATGVPVIPLDLPGTGTKHARECPLSVERIARDLEIATRPDATVGLLGISFGGMVALEAANFHGRRVSHLVLINSSSRLSPTIARLQPVGMLRFFQALRERDPHKREELIYALTTTTSPRVLQHYATEAARIAATAPVSRRTAVRQLLAAASYWPKPVPARCLVLAGARDRVVDPLCSATLAGFLRGPLVTHPTGGHDLPVEDPNWITSRIRRWVTS